MPPGLWSPSQWWAAAATARRVQLYVASRFKLRRKLDSDERELRVSRGHFDRFPARAGPAPRPRVFGFKFATVYHRGHLLAPAASESDQKSVCRRVGCSGKFSNWCPLAIRMSCSRSLSRGSIPSRGLSASTRTRAAGTFVGVTCELRRPLGPEPECKRA